MFEPPTRRLSWYTCLLTAVLATGFASGAAAERTRVAVAANFTEAANEISRLFHAGTGHTAVLSFASTGQLYVQITQGAPYDIYLAADRKRPRKAAAEGYAVPGSRFTYATGRLVLYSRDASLVEGETTLHAGRFERLAVANPTTAPYGAAAVGVIRALGIHERLAGRLVQGNNVAQAYQFVATGNADLGFVALSQVVEHDRGSRWLVPESLHAPVAQDAVLLKRGAGNPAARAFMAFLKGPEARAVKERFGYGPGD